MTELVGLFLLGWRVRLFLFDMLGLVTLRFRGDQSRAMKCCSMRLI